MVYRKIEKDKLREFSKFYKMAIDILEVVKNYSTCRYYSVGAVLLDKHNRISGEGYNGTPSKTIQCNEYHNILHSLISDFIDNIYKLRNDNNKKNNINISELIYDDGFLRGIFRRNNNIKHIIQKYNNENLSEDIYITYRQIIENEIKNEIDELIYIYDENKEEYKNWIDNIVKIYNRIHSRYEIHAEQNLILFSERDRLKEGIIFITHEPCLECAKLILQSGIKKVIFIEDYMDKRFNEHSRYFLHNYGIEVIKVI